MSNNLDIYKQELEKSKSLMLSDYKDLVVAYEKDRQLYEKLIKEYESAADSDEKPVVKCSTIVAENLSFTSTYWAIYTIDGTKLYTSDKKYRLQTWRYDLANLTNSDGTPLLPGTQLILKAEVYHGSDSSSPVILEYAPLIDASAMFELKGTAFNTTLHFISVVG